MKPLREAIAVTDLREVISILKSNAKKIRSVGSTQEFERVMNQLFNPYKIFIEPSDQPTTGNKMLSIAGLAVGSFKPPMNIYVGYLPGVQFMIKTNDGWRRFIKAFLAILSHEDVHRQQIMKLFQSLKQRGLSGRDFDRIYNKIVADPANIEDYLSNKFEIGAFASQAYFEIKEHIIEKRGDAWRKSFPATMRNLFNTDHPSSHEYFPITNVYLHVFPKNHPALNRFVKEIIKRFNEDKDEN